MEKTLVFFFDVVVPAKMQLGKCFVLRGHIMFHRPVKLKGKGGGNLILNNSRSEPSLQISVWIASTAYS